MTALLKYDAACVGLADNHLRMIAAIESAVRSELDGMHDAIDAAQAAGEEISDDEQVTHVFSALLNVAHNYMQARAAIATPAELALQFLLAVNAVAGDLAAAYFYADATTDPAEPVGGLQ